MKRVLIILAVLTIYAVVAVNAQDSATEAPTPAPQVTEVVVIPPAPTAVETALPPENPRGGIQWADIAPYLFLIIGVLVLAFFTLGTTALVLVYKSMPPAGQAVLVGVVSSLLSEYRKEATVSPDTLDDMISKAMDSKWIELQRQFQQDVMISNHATLVG